MHQSLTLSYTPDPPTRYNHPERTKGFIRMKALLLTSLLLLTGCPKNQAPSETPFAEIRDLAAESIENGNNAITAVPEASAEAGWQMGVTTQVLGPLTIGQVEPVFDAAQERLDMCFNDIPGGLEFANGLSFRIMVTPSGQVYEAGLRQFLKNEGPWVGCVISHLVRLRFSEVEGLEPTTIYRYLKPSK
jgi:hypothetical protein